MILYPAAPTLLVLPKLLSLGALATLALTIGPMRMPANAQEKEPKGVKNESFLKEIRDADQDLRVRAFWIAYPLGIGAIIAGAVLRRQAVGRGLLLGGLCLLAYGAYMFWDRMELWLRLASLAIALAAVFTLRQKLPRAKS